MRLRVTLYGEPVLRKKGSLVTVFDEALKALVTDMVDTMHVEEGVGLAAQQVGKALQLFVIDLSVMEKTEHFVYLIDGRQPPIELCMPMALINAEFEFLGERDLAGEEGCLSFPELRGDVMRYPAVRGSFQDVKGNRHTIEAEEWFARVLQHEFDHNQGVLFIDHMTPQSLRKIETQIKQLKRRNQPRKAR
jgi:peptide deformylase